MLRLGKLEVLSAIPLSSSDGPYFYSVIDFIAGCKFCLEENGIFSHALGNLVWDCVVALLRLEIVSGSFCFAAILFTILETLFRTDFRWFNDDLRPEGVATFFL